MAVRPARPADLARLQTIEDAADALLVDALQPDAWWPAPTGEQRAAQPGFLLVAAEEEDGEAVGFVHVLGVDGAAHLEQLSVLPSAARRGHGRALVEAAKATAAAREFRIMTLRTYADLPWNAPFYRSCGFAVSTPDTPFLTDLRAAERRIGLERWGERVQMTAELP